MCVRLLKFSSSHGLSNFNKFLNRWAQILLLRVFERVRVFFDNDDDDDDDNDDDDDDDDGMMRR